MEEEKKQFTTEWCKYVLTEEEMREKATFLAQKTQEKEEVELEKKAVASKYKERIETIEAEVKKAASVYKDGYEMRDVECEIKFDKEGKLVHYVRTDNGEVARSREMTGSERQLTVVEAEENAKLGTDPPAEEENEEPEAAEAA